MKALGVSLNRLSVVFKQQYGITPFEYQDDKRAKCAKTLLVKTDVAIIDIAYSIGHNSLSSFYAFFKKHTGVTPQTFRTSEVH